MRLKTLYLRNFRSYEEKEFGFTPKMNVIFGNNGKGKTNLLEAIVLLATGQSFRTLHLSEAIRSGQSFFYIEAEVEREARLCHHIKLSFDGEKKSLSIDGTKSTHFSPLLGLLPSVLYAPSDEEMITGAPLVRRRFLNLHLAQSDPLYVHHLSRFWRSMKQRNVLLKAKTEDAIECWEAEMAQAGQYLQEKRGHLVEELEKPLAKWSCALTNSELTHKMRFHPSYPQDPNAYAKQLIRNRRREQDIGATLTGPHRDDLSFWIGERAARLFASEGQKKSFTAALKMSEWEQLKSKVGVSPILAVDDLSHSLDAARQESFFKELLNCGQVFVTTPLLPKAWEEHPVIEIR